MLQKEFEDRTGVKVSIEEYSAIDRVYMESDLDKDEFCMKWRKMNANRVRESKIARAKQIAKEKDTAKLHRIYSKIENKCQKLLHDFMKEPLTVNFLTESETSFLLNHGIMLNISQKEMIDYGYSFQRYYRISETAYHIRKYLGIA